MGIRLTRAKQDVEAGQATDTAGTGISLRTTKRRLDNKLKDLGAYLPLYKAALSGEWRDARMFLDDEPEALTAKITIASETALHIAVGTGKSIDLVEKLIRRMSPEDLALTDINGDTALAVAAVVGNIDAAKLLVNKNPDLPNVSGKSGLPIHRAAQYGQRVMVVFLFGVTREDIEPSAFSGTSGARLLISLIVAGFYDIALQLVERNAELATIEVNGLGSPLTVLAGKPTAFPSGCGVAKWHHLFFNPVAYLKHLRQELVHAEVLKLVKSMCMEIVELDDTKAFSMFQQPLHLAAKLGIPEIMEEIVEVFPPAIWSSDEDNRNVFQIAVMNRRENVFNLIFQMSDFRHLVTRYTDSHGNNMLHLAGRLPPLDRLNLVSGAALQLQRELQWFKEVEKFVTPAQKEEENDEGKTPAAVFTDSHQKMVKQGEKWMKNTTTSLTVAATLIATIVFAAVIQVPGGNRDDGRPAFDNHKTFIVFTVTDAVSFFSSVTSILMFLSILTSRYAEADFRYALPVRLIIGLTMLFISITTMMAAFSATLYLVFCKEKAWTLIPIGVLFITPVTLFVCLQYRLFGEMVMSTCCRGIFGKQKGRVLH